MSKEKVRKDEEGWVPTTADPVRKEDRSLDIGEMTMAIVSLLRIIRCRMTVNATR
jgi:hypothetical protein